MLQEYLTQRERPLFSSMLKSSLPEQPVSAPSEHPPVDTPPNPGCATGDPGRACLTTGAVAGALVPRFAGQPRPLLLRFAARHNIPLLFGCLGTLNLLMGGEILLVR